ncbi:rRNA maturation RNase YbeY [Cyanobium sp. Tous-M-B4]|uniref:rRNA maturation RNase YbeY n=3 Tax=unclassified Cyanobium TaxID=2627006 RepID=UPI0020CD1F7B|nr:rRNA maturation RNase YbeY [Cyanobium sp. Tous-M-B4]MCP9776730.1 rRNA maturation RNase YbeY [Cyanobium sp. Tous-M-B4]
MPASTDLDLAFSADPDLADPDLEVAPQLTGVDYWQALLSGWLDQLAPELPTALQAPAYSLGLSLVADAEIAELNADWREKEGPTDVLAFAAQDEATDGTPPMPAHGEAEPLELGDIVISVETAARQAPEHGHDLEQELLFLASHGLLHLLGWDHPDEASLAAMLARQKELVKVPAEP